ncbi:hypothetical protein AYO20_08435 [Fonsecaea nubica]|uniref:Aminoacyl-tRNA synthetase class Ia domain-containing protein n=1 Tax=Fonsecaea nubica TaxID=856822 RepID=A0A178CP84_9EURO|nr:hypothetical protein AYO20_08435 [Fonsecaea nubica]OAL31104.1 hypothetical protein AYO20_08435 [Fonsecaea nubica]
MRVNKQLRRPKDKKLYTFYDGPPFKVGLPHYDHLLVSTAKDIIPRYWSMEGYYAGRRFLVPFLLLLHFLLSAIIVIIQVMNLGCSGPMVVFVFLHFAFLLTWTLTNGAYKDSKVKSPRVVHVTDHADAVNGGLELRVLVLGKTGVVQRMVNDVEDQHGGAGKARFLGKSQGYLLPCQPPQRYHASSRGSASGQMCYPAFDVRLHSAVNDSWICSTAKFAYHSWENQREAGSQSVPMRASASPYDDKISSDDDDDDDEKRRLPGPSFFPDTSVDGLHEAMGLTTPPRTTASQN